MAPTMVMLESSSHAVSVLQKLHVLQKEQKLCDVRLTTDTGGVSAHRLVLIATSPYLQSRLSVEDINSMELIYFEKIPVSYIEAVVNFMYTGKLEASTSNNEELLKFCEDLELYAAVDLLKEYISSIVGSSETLQIETTGNSISQNDASNSIKNHLPQNYIERTVEDLETHKIESEARRSNRRVKQTPKKRAAGETAMSSEEAIPNKVVKLNSDAPTLKGITEKSKITKTRTKTDKNIANQSRRANKKTAETVTKRASCISDKTTSKKVGKTKVYHTDKEEDKTEHEKLEGQKEKKPATKSRNTRQKFTKLKDVIDPRTIEIVNDEKDMPKYIDSFDTEQAEINDPEAFAKAKSVKKGRKVPSSISEVRKLKEYPCSVCDKVLTTNKRLVFHEFSQHGIDYDKTKYKMVPCPVQGCTYISVNQNNLKTHMNSRHGTERPHVCEFCGKAFKLQNILTTHLNIHTGARTFTCKQCGEQFNQQAGLDVHIKRHHAGEASWGELCHLCSEKFIQKSELCWHLFRVHNQPLPDRYKAYVCDICDYFTKSSQDLERHKNAHDGIKRFICTICKRSCATKSELKRHAKFHGEKSYRCTYENCTYASTDAQGLKKHIHLSHTHKHYKPYVCSVCKYKTGVKGNLDKHIRQVHNLEVVTKHTVNHKVKYKNFQTGDIITKDGQLVISAHDRKLQQQQALKQTQNNVEATVIVDAEVDTSVESIIICDSYPDQGVTRTQTDAGFVVPQPRKYHDSLTGAQISTEMEPRLLLQGSGKYQDSNINVLGAQETVQIASCEPVSSQNRVLAGCLNSQVPHPLTAQDLRISLSSHLDSPHLYQEEIQTFDNSPERVKIFYNCENENL